MSRLFFFFSSELESDSKSEDKTEFESGDNPKGSSSKVKFHKTSRPWTPLEIFNEKYEEELKERETKPKVKDYIEENVVGKTEKHFIDFTEVNDYLLFSTYSLRPTTILSVIIL